MRLALLALVLCTSSFASLHAANAAERLAAASAEANVDYFLKIDGIEGESKDAKHAKELDIESFSWGLSNSGSQAGGGGGAGKASFQDFHFTSKVSKASPKLFAHCAKGQHIKNAVLVARKKGEKPLEYIKITLEEVLVSSYQSAGSQTTAPTDSFSLNFTKITFEYAEQKPDGSFQIIKESFDLKQNR